MRKILYSAFAAVVVVGGCAAASHLDVLQPQQIAASPPLIVPEDVAIHAPAFQQGIDVDAYTYPRQDFSAAAEHVVKYVKTLHANSISISFPIFMANGQSSSVFASKRTPSTVELALFVGDAERAGLYVSLRPLLSESQIGGNRTTWRPVHMAAWFASYRNFLMPYVEMAQANKVGMFIVGAEFSRFGRSPFWNRLDRAFARVFHGRLAYSSNGPGDLTRSSGGLYTYKAVDAYPPLKAPTVRAWQAYDRRLPKGTILTELGITAYNGAWRTPWAQRHPGRPINPRVQVNWFLAACKAAHTAKLRGIYFWSIGLTTTFELTSTDHPGAWADSVGAAAITHCFKDVR